MGALVGGCDGDDDGIFVGGDDGALVGGASLDADKFVDIIKSVNL